ncbi:uncharacterized protein LAESUDRAFT_714932 [Laetiporus sulphureus 93-53]|uniref:Uncharacterized protein n=1 Tax=Laetiporus sulphureus 93-53 TaxID=1314785 RepID=A0A165DQD9_9APHY|nr:uncharacterized protein LAESUDRAFT_714932 [Laetiporus sulphureus 93-53]KZT05395.1 hypothetical protein LAESUDRAFT_714932 [Laetiporus sulphureus 93-53]
MPALFLDVHSDYLRIRVQSSSSGIGLLDNGPLSVKRLPFTTSRERELIVEIHVGSTSKQVSYLYKGSSSECNEFLDGFTVGAAPTLAVDVCVKRNKHNDLVGKHVVPIVSLPDRKQCELVIPLSSSGTRTHAQEVKITVEVTFSVQSEGPTVATGPPSMPIQKATHAQMMKRKKKKGKKSDKQREGDHLATTSKSVNAPGPSTAGGSTVSEAEEWLWEPHLKQKWETAPQTWQQFLQHWSSQPDEDTEPAPYSMSLGLATRPPNLPSTILVLASYKKLFDRAWDFYNRYYRQGILLTGQPGTGKSTWLWYVLTRLLRRGKNVVLSWSGDVFLFYSGTVYEVQSGAFSGNYLPRPPLLGKNEKDSSLRYIWGLIDAESTGWSTQRKAHTWGMPLWEPEELKRGFELQDQYEALLEDVTKAYMDPSLPRIPAVANVMQAADDNHDDNRGTHGGCERALKPLKKSMLKKHARLQMLKTLENVIDLYGHSARDVYMGVFDPDTMRARLLHAVRNVTWADLRKGLPSDNPGELSHRIVAVIVKPADGPAEDQFFLGFKSDHIQREVEDRLKLTQIDDAFSLLRNCLVTPRGTSLGGFVFENLANSYLSGLTPTTPEYPSLLPMRRSPQGRTFVAPEMPVVASTPTLSLPIRRRTRTKFEVNKSSAVRLKLPVDECFYIPISQNNPLFDSFMIECDDDGATLWIFQMTVGKEHRGSASGYDIITGIEEFVRRQLRQHAKVPSDEDGSVIGQKRSGPAPEGSRKKLKSACEHVDVKSKFVLVCPDQAQQWTMPIGWKDDKGSVYCQTIPIQDYI